MRPFLLFNGRGTTSIDTTLKDTSKTLSHNNQVLKSDIKQAGNQMKANAAYGVGVLLGEGEKTISIPLTGKTFKINVDLQTSGDAVVLGKGSVEVNSEYAALKLTRDKSLKGTLDSKAMKVSIDTKDASINFETPVVQNDYFKSTYGGKTSLKTLSSNELFTIDTNTEMNKGPSALLQVEVTTDYKKAVKERAVVGVAAVAVAGLVVVPEITLPILGGGAQLAPAFR